MKFFEIKHGYYWGGYILGRPFLLKLSLYRMICTDVNRILNSGHNINIVPIDKDIAKKCENTPYRVKKLYKTAQGSFYGLAAINEENHVCGYVCGKKLLSEEKDKLDLFNGQDYFYIKYVYVDPKYRGRKLSALLIEKLADAINLPLTLNCRTNNSAALKVYRSIGFKSVSIFEQIYCPVIHQGIKYRDEVIDDNHSMDNLIGLRNRHTQ